ncbi:VacJ family lipoprotein [Sphingomonas sp. HH69]
MLLSGVAAGMMLIGTQAGAAPQLPVEPVVETVPTAPPVQAEDEVQDIVVTGDRAPPKGDPLENINAQSFETVQSVDKNVVGPMAQAYNSGVPRPARKGLRNFFSNLQEPVVFVAYLLQFKPGKAAETAGRFAINSTLGFVGLFDVAKRKPFHLPYRPNGLANTLGFYGVGPGPYMYLPVIGPTTLRDIVGYGVDSMVTPFVLGAPFNKPAYVIPANILRQLGERAAFDERITDIRAQEDPYGTYRDLYLKQRKAEIEALHGRVSEEPVVPMYGPGLGVPGKAKDASVVPDSAPLPETAPE